MCGGSSPVGFGIAGSKQVEWSVVLQCLVPRPGSYALAQNTHCEVLVGPLGSWMTWPRAIQGDMTKLVTCSHGGASPGNHATELARSARHAQAQTANRRANVMYARGLVK